LPFWVCETNSQFSSFDRRDASLDGSCAVHEIRVPCRIFRSILNEFGIPFYLKVDIQGNDFLCVEALDPRACLQLGELLRENGSESNAEHLACG